MSEEQSWACGGEAEEGSAPVQLCGWCCCAVPRWELRLFPSPRWGSRCPCTDTGGAGPSQTTLCLSQPLPSFPHQARTLGGISNLSKEFWKTRDLLSETAAGAGSTCEQGEAGWWHLYLAYRDGVNSEATLGSGLQGQATIPAEMHQLWTWGVMRRERRAEWGETLENSSWYPQAERGLCPEQTCGGLRGITRASPGKMS